jgi:DeoR family transcriptional regulator of aga operon
LADPTLPEPAPAHTLRRERHRRIKEMVDADRQVKVGDLARHFGVTAMTIRRDLTELDLRGLIKRTHGGAISSRSETGSVEPPMLDRIAEEPIEKRRIAQAVAGMVEDGEMIFLGSGTTALAVAQALAGRTSLTVITNSLTVANALVTSRGITLVVVGGFLRREELSLIGHFAESAMKDMRVHKVIMGIRGIDADYGLSSDHLQELMTDRAILGLSDEVIIVADHTKFGHRAAGRTAPVTAATMVVTDIEAPADTVAAIRELGVKVIQV